MVTRDSLELLGWNAMVSVKWCLKQKKGIKAIQPNKNMAISYIKMAEESSSVLPGVEKSRIWTTTISYYVYYHSLYALMMRIGVKSEIHSCSLAFMKKYLKGFYSKTDMKMIEKAFNARINLQYYANRPVSNDVIKEVKRHCKDFYLKTKDILDHISEKQINEIREVIS